MAIEKKFPKAPSDVIYVAISFMQKWSHLLKEKDKEFAEHILKKLTSWLKSFRPSVVMLSDVVEV
jgi:hypothetical protein